ncbi:MAG: zinc ribbon domain-containing protein [Ruminococcaceae bacterium]|nr:zinc ribbon domain-containing protein [Oscillospiraceae bacterium]
MAFKRAEWHSGLTYRQTCEECKTVVIYMDDKLDFRPWYPDGFVYCPKCNTPLRHSERYAIDAPETTGVMTVGAAAVSGNGAIFCTGCGKQLSVGDAFCSGCGKKVELPTKKVCSSCGNESHEADALFCTKCGNKL